MLGVLICVLAILLPLGSSSPIVSPEGIVQSYGIEALFGREAEFGIKHTPRDPGPHSSLQNPTAQLGLLQPLQEAVVLDHRSQTLKKHDGSQGEAISLHGALGYKELPSFVSYDSHGSPILLGNRGFHSYDSSGSAPTEKMYGTHPSLHPKRSHISQRIQGSHDPNSRYRSHSPSPKSFKSLTVSGSYNPHMHTNPVVLIRKGRQADPVPSRSDTLLRGIISDIRKDFLNPAGIGSFNPQPSNRVITFSDPDPPSRTEGLLTGIISGIKKDIFVEGDPRVSSSPPLPSTSSSPLSLASLTSSPSPISSTSPTSPSPLKSLPLVSSSISASPSPSSPPAIPSLSVISPAQSTPDELFSNSSPSPLLSSSSTQSPASVTTSIAPARHSTPSLVSPLPSPPASPLPSSLSDVENSDLPGRSTNLLKGILSGIRRDIFSSTSSNSRDGRRTPQDKVRERRTILEALNEVLA